MKRHALVLVFAIGLCLFGAVAAQQQTPPKPAAPLLHKPAEQLSPAAAAARLEVHKAQVFKGVPLTAAQQQLVLGNLSEVGCHPPMQVMQQQFQPVPPPAQASGAACSRYYAGTNEQLRALRAALTRLVEQNNASDVPIFQANTPKDCPYKELYYYLDLLAQLAPAPPGQ